MAIDGGTMVGWVKGGGRLGSEPEGGARFIAGPPGASGIEDGGTGGGRSENIWAETAPGISKRQRKRKPREKPHRAPAATEPVTP